MQIWTSYRPDNTPGGIAGTVEVYLRYLGDYSYTDVSMALDIFARTDTAGFAPSPGQLIHAMQLPKEHGTMNATAAWNLVRHAISQSGWGHAQEEFDRLPSAAQKAVGSPEQLVSWGYEENLNLEVVMSQFIRAYNVEVERENEYAKMPERVKRLIDATCTDLTRRIETHTVNNTCECECAHPVPMTAKAKKMMAEMFDG